MRRVLRSTLLLFATTTLFAGCQEEFGIDHPEGAYLAFRDALLSSDTEAVWAMLDEPAQQAYTAAYDDLVALSESVDLLSPGDQAIVRTETGLSLLEVVDDPLGLFEQLTHFNYVVGDDTYRQGMEPSEVVYAPGADAADITTASGQSFRLELDEEARWRLVSFTVPDIDDTWRSVSFEGLAAARLAPISQNVLTVELMVAQTASSQRSEAEIEMLLRGQWVASATEPAATSPTGEGSGDPAPTE